ncbi:hypothetical protein HDC96_002257 [Stenotrophomonas sp. JAI102]|nr:hypothetical protein [Stenotrophomonas sp. JAI102]
MEYIQRFAIVGAVRGPDIPVLGTAGLGIELKRDYGAGVQ